MGKAKAPLPVKLIMPMFTRRVELFRLAEDALVGQFGPVDYHSPRLTFAHTGYYEEEFGPGLQRQFLSFEKLIDPGKLADVKLLTNALERRWSLAGRRPINLDPGYISPEKLVLATTKNHGHRIYLGRGIYAEVTLTYRNKAYRPWPWTYPDYRSEAYLEIMQAIRRVYMGQLRELRRDPGATRR